MPLIPSLGRWKSRILSYSVSWRLAWATEDLASLPLPPEDAMSKLRLSTIKLLLKWRRSPYEVSFGDERSDHVFSYEARDQVTSYRGWGLGEKLSDCWPEGKRLTSHLL